MTTVANKFRNILNLHLPSFIALVSVVTLSTAILFGSAEKSFAHANEPSVADIVITETDIKITFNTWLETYMARIDMGRATSVGEDNSIESQMYWNLRERSVDEIIADFKDEWPDMKRLIALEADGEPLDFFLDEVTSFEPEFSDDPRWSQIEVIAKMPNPEAKITLGWDDRLGLLAVRQLEAGEDAFAGLLPLGSMTPELSATEGASFGATFIRAVISGFEHIIPKGLDHILFVLGLFFFALKMRPLLWQVTAFTLAHTVTLALASLGIVTLPGSIVEPLIAASIAYIAIENIFGKGEITPWRTALVFAFGLLHGLGFASVMADVGFSSNQFITALIGFNIGVEIGQLTVILAAFLLLGLPFGKKEWYGNFIAKPISALIGFVGLYWTIERIFF